MRKSILTSFSITLLLTVFGAGAAYGRESAAAGSPFMQRRGAVVRFVPRQIRQANKKLRYTIKARYPEAIGARNTPRLAKLNEELKAFITNEVSQFTTDFSAPEERTFSAGSTFDARYQVELASNNLVSIGFVVNTYFEGAAHGNNNLVTFNYDLSLGRSLSLKDLFQPNSDYLKVISDYAIKALKKQSAPDPDVDWIQSGAGPEEKNYQSWNLTRRGLEVTFNPYQVASYAEGPKVVIVPYSVLKSVIDQNGVLSRIYRQ